MTSGDPFAPAIRIAQASRSPMERAAAAFDPLRYRIFCAAYASMRVIDDYVDDGFLAGTPKARQDGRAEAAAVVEAWRRHAVAALTEGAAPPAGVRFAETHEALAAIHEAADVDPSPWRDLAMAMARDVDERPMATWADFEAYAEGATAAPAAVFIEILGLKGDARLRSALEGPAVERIRNCAFLLYLVHIMRDLAEDAAKGGALLTVPDAVFDGLGVSAEEFGAAAGRDAGLLAAARGVIGAYSERYLLPALAELTALDAALEPEEAAILRNLCMPYIERYEQFRNAE